MNNSIKLTIIKILKDTINKIENNECSLDDEEQYKKDIVDGENILKELNPQFAKDKARDDQISTLNNKVSNMEDTLNKIVTMLSDSTKH